ALTSLAFDVVALAFGSAPPLAAAMAGGALSACTAAISAAPIQTFMIVPPRRHLQIASHGTSPQAPNRRRLAAVSRCGAVEGGRHDIRNEATHRRRHSGRNMDRAGIRLGTGSARSGNFSRNGKQPDPARDGDSDLWRLRAGGRRGTDRRAA